MARDIWMISDTHFGHDGIITYANRPFASAAEADAYMAEAWRETVKDQDLVYHLGDVAWTPEGIALFASLPGTKRVIIGNHDDGRALAPMVQRLTLYRRFPQHGFIASHMPMLMERGREPVNVHGHVHHVDVGAPGYVNISVEKTGYRPIHLDEVAELVRKELVRMLRPAADDIL